MKRIQRANTADSRLRAGGERGMALVTALLVMSFLTVVGGALLSSSRIDIQIADNYRNRAQIVSLAEAGLDAGREALRASANTLDDDLAAAAGADNTLATSRNLAALLASDDQPLLPSDNSLRAAGRTLTDTTGATVGTYHVFIRNDPADGVTSVADTNDFLTLVSIARIGDSTHTIEAVVRRGSFPPVPAALTLNGDVGEFDAANSNLFQIDGNDQGGSGNNENAIGVVADADITEVLDEIPDNREDNYAGSGNQVPPPADVANVSADLDPMMTTASGMEEIVASIAASATDVYNPGFGNVTALGSIGSPTDYRVIVVNGDCEFGPGTGYGILVVRGELEVSGNFTWNGLILIIGQGELHWNGGGHGEVQGGMFIAKTRNDDEDATNPFGTVAASLGSVVADFNGGGGNGILYNTTTINAASDQFPFTPVSIREY